MIDNTINDDRTVAGGGEDMILAGRDGEKERRCNRKVAPLKQRFLTRCNRMAVSDAVCVI